MTQLGFIIAGWGATFGVLGIYAAVLINRGRALTKEVSEDRLRWMTTVDASKRSDATETSS